MNTLTQTREVEQAALSRSKAVELERGDSTLDDLVLQHLRSRGFESAAGQLEIELKSRPPASALAADASRPTLTSLLVSSAAPMYAKCYEELSAWVETSLDAYKPELRAVLFPLFVHSYLQVP